MPKAKKWEEYKTECEAVAKPGITILGWVGEWKGKSTKLLCSCELHGKWTTTNIGNFRTGSSCPACARLRATEKQTSKWEDELKLCEQVKKDGISILGFIPPYTGTKTKLRLYCEEHGEWCSTSIAKFKDGRCCPGCKRDGIGKWNAKSWEEYLPSIKVVADLKGYTIKGHGKWRGNKTKLKLFCPLHGEWNSASINGFLTGNGCPECRRVAFDERIRVPDATHLAEFMSTGKFKKGTTFKRNTSKVDAKGCKSYWDYTCPVCSNDEYVKEGLCSGVFIARTSDLKRGKRPCRCTKSYRYTKEQWEYRITKECESRGYVFIGWKGKRWGNVFKFTYECPVHGAQSITPHDIFSGKGCSLCAGHNQRECYLNVVKDGNLPIALKLGISRDSNIRLKKQNSRNRLSMEQMVLYMFPTAEQCKSAERYCKKTLKRGVVSKQDMPDGWTETVALTDYDKVVSIYERFGGVRVDTLTKEAV